LKLNFQKYFILIPVSFLLTGFAFAQNISFDNVLDALDIENYPLAEERLKLIDTSKVSDYDKATWLFYNADIQFKLDNHNAAYLNIIKSKKLFKILNSESDISNCNFLAISILSHQNSLESRLSTIDRLIEEEHDKALKNKDSTALRKIYYRIAANLLHYDNGPESIKYFRKIIEIDKTNNDSVKIGYSLDNIGTVYQTTSLNNIDSARYYTSLAEPIFKKYNDVSALFNNYNNQAEQYMLINDYENAISFYQKADSLPIKKYIRKSKIILYENLTKAYEAEGNYIKSLKYLKKLDSIKGNVEQSTQNIEISKIIEEFDNETLRAEKAESEASRLESEAKRIQNRNLLFGALGLIFFGSIVFYLIQKNTKRKQKLAEQEKVLESQKLDTVLKEQELATIDAMIAGQEKERQRIANDLHDDLGGLMATVKLHFNALKDKDSPELFKKTNNLIEEAYQKVRSIAHAKNSGVIAKQGLLKAVKHMAEKVSASNQLNIEVVDHDLDQRMENSLELTLFRIIQELITNVVKHAEASEATIHLTNHDDSINIMVEDNGKGFNPSQITKTRKGMGISSIDKRVEHLDGKLTIESEKNKGTTVIIDIPL